MPQWVKIREGLDHRTESGLLQGGAQFLATDAELEAFGDKFTTADAPQAVYLTAEDMLESAEQLELEAAALDSSVPMTKAAARLAAEYGLAESELQALEPSGKDGQLLVNDIKSHLKERD